MLEPVSYTHLDVYKRQIYNYSYIFFPFIFFGSLSYYIINPCVSASTNLDDCFSFFMSPYNTVCDNILVTRILVDGRYLYFVPTGISTIVPIFTYFSYFSLSNRHHAVSYTHLDVYKRQMYTQPKSNKSQGHYSVGVPKQGIYQQFISTKNEAYPRRFVRFSAASPPELHCSAIVSG